MGRGPGVRAHWASVGAQWPPNNTNIPKNVPFLITQHLDPISSLYLRVIICYPNSFNIDQYFNLYNTLKKREKTRYLESL